MLPNQGQGATQSLEDAGALGAFFRNMSDASMASVNARLKLFDALRRPRASVVQLISHQPYFEDGVERMRPQLEKILPRDKLPKNRTSLREWFYSYDVVKEAEAVLKSYLGE